jgi:hypothetical protein
MVFEFKVNGALSSRQRDFFDFFLPRNLVDLGDVLVDDSVQEVTSELSMFT